MRDSTQSAPGAVMTTENEIRLLADVMTSGKAGGLIGTPSKGATNQGPPKGGSTSMPPASRLG
jgi:hypothetical protein